MWTSWHTLFLLFCEVNLAASEEHQKLFLSRFISSGVQYSSFYRQTYLTAWKSVQLCLLGWLPTGCKSLTCLWRHPRAFILIIAFSLYFSCVCMGVWVFACARVCSSSPSPNLSHMVLFHACVCMHLSGVSSSSWSPFKALCFLFVVLLLRFTLFARWQKISLVHPSLSLKH